MFNPKIVTDQTSEIKNVKTGNAGNDFEFKF